MRLGSASGGELEPVPQFGQVGEVHRLRDHPAAHHADPDPPVLAHPVPPPPRCDRSAFWTSSPRVCTVARWPAQAAPISPGCRSLRRTAVLQCLPGGDEARPLQPPPPSPAAGMGAVAASQRSKEAPMDQLERPLSRRTLLQRGAAGAAGLYAAGAFGLAEAGQSQRRHAQLADLVRPLLPGTAAGGPEGDRHRRAAAALQRRRRRVHQGQGRRRRLGHRRRRTRSGSRSSTRRA